MIESWCFARLLTSVENVPLQTVGWHPMVRIEGTLDELLRLTCDICVRSNQLLNRHRERCLGAYHSPLALCLSLKYFTRLWFDFLALTNMNWVSQLKDNEGGKLNVRREENGGINFLNSRAVTSLRRESKFLDLAHFLTRF